MIQIMAAAGTANAAAKGAAGVVKGVAGVISSVGNAVSGLFGGNRPDIIEWGKVSNNGYPVSCAVQELDDSEYLLWLAFRLPSMPRDWFVNWTAPVKAAGGFHVNSIKDSDIVGPVMQQVQSSEILKREFVTLDSTVRWLRECWSNGTFGQIEGNDYLPHYIVHDNGTGGSFYFRADGSRDTSVRSMKVAPVVAASATSSSAVSPAGDLGAAAVNTASMFGASPVSMILWVALGLGAVVFFAGRKG